MFIVQLLKQLVHQQYMQVIDLLLNLCILRDQSNETHLFQEIPELLFC